VGTHARQLAAVARESWRVVVLGAGGLVTLLAAALVVAVAPRSAVGERPARSRRRPRSWRTPWRIPARRSR
jgi:hypothetical protein